MRKDIVESIPYRGFNIEIMADDDAQSPEDMGDDNAFLVHYHRDCHIENKLCPRNVLGYIYTKNADDYDKDGAKALLKTHHFFPVAAYIHSGVVLSIGACGQFPDQQWDVSHVGGFFCSKSEWPKRADALKYAQGQIETWNDYLSGSVYGYDIEDVDGSCWGFYGYDHKASGLLDAAQGAIDYHIETIRTKHTARIKTLIAAHCPIAYRANMPSVLQLPYAALSA